MRSSNRDVWSLRLFEHTFITTTMMITTTMTTTMIIAVRVETRNFVNVLVGAGIAVVVVFVTLVAVMVLVDIEVALLITVPEVVDRVEDIEVTAVVRVVRSPVVVGREVFVPRGVVKMGAAVVGKVVVVAGAEVYSGRGGSRICLDKKLKNKVKIVTINHAPHAVAEILAGEQMNMCFWFACELTHAWPQSTRLNAFAP